MATPQPDKTYPLFVLNEGERGKHLYDTCLAALTTDADGPHYPPEVAAMELGELWPSLIAALEPEKAES